METMTAQGTAVTLTPSTQRVHPTIVGVVAVELTHPKAGKIAFVSRKWSVAATGEQGIEGSASVGGKYQTVRVTVPREAFDTVLAEANILAEIERNAAEVSKACQKARVQAACPPGYEIARQNWSNGDLCSAEYTTADGIKVVWADNQTNQGGGWYYIPTAEADKARAESAHKAEEKAAATQAEAEHLATITAEAAATGKDVLLRQWAEDCTDPEEECDVDRCYRWVRPNGTQYTTRNHTW